MNILFDLRMLSLLIALVALFQCFPVLLAVALGEDPAPLWQSILLALLASALGLLASRRASNAMSPRDGFLVTSLGWFLAAFFGGLPYVLHGGLDLPSAFFEAASGFTTTGSSTMTDIEVWPQSILLWRSITQWLGGMGMVLMMIAILPLLGAGGTQLMKAEVPGPTKDRMTPRLISTARALWGVYTLITLVGIGGFILFGMTALDAVNHAFTAIATGGFSTKNLSLGYFSPAIQWWAIVIMFMGGTNFLIHYRVLVHGDWKALTYEEFLGYLGIIFGFTLYCVLVLMQSVDWSWEELVRHSLFQVITIMTTTGFASTDWEQWPAVLQLLMGVLMVIGGMSGSTGGGMKVVRVIILLKTIPAVTIRLLQPYQIAVSKMDRQPLSREILENAVATFILSMGYVLCGGILLNAMDMDLLSAMGASLTAWANVGPGFNTVGAMDNFAHVPAFGKVMLGSMMIVGRLEIFTILMLFSHKFWRS
ncbi:TrkH family potassium uptake protein [Candidatus Magnetaquicoccus inordinatus]|uniref:TrkH family potassium uptake protein n=1 Tax=Candidatus Magnetaquicoccus inordinatus TaxID=2496818 RepID=UPI00102AC7E7|nr:TrkH family potassium uptake protein [Candidatus Magnetaquicoccus inordinatus]